jgi:hypothetical protein
MKKKYIAPAAEVVNVHLISSVLGDENLPIEDGSVVGTGMDAKEQQLEWEEDATSNLPSDINLWEDTDDTDGY